VLNRENTCLGWVLGAFLADNIVEIDKAERTFGDRLLQLACRDFAD
jgi:hypothetical protein